MENLPTVVKHPDSEDLLRIIATLIAISSETDEEAAQVFQYLCEKEPALHRLAGL